MDLLNAMQISQDVEGLDTSSKEFLKNKEVLAIILKRVVPEYQEYTETEIMGFIETSSITSEKDVSNGRSNTRIEGKNTEFKVLNEKTSNFDILFQAKNPVLSTLDLQVNLHIDIEPQRTYRTGYPIEKRGIYYLAREMSAQFNLATDDTDYNLLEKCYSIWICRDDIPKEQQESISVFHIQHKAVLGNCIVRHQDYDLLSLIIIRLSPDHPASDKLIRFLNTVFTPHGDDFMKIMSEYIDFSKNKQLQQEVADMSGLGVSILTEGIEKGIEKGEQNIIELYNWLMEHGKREDAIAIMKPENVEFRNRLLKEYKQASATNPQSS
ncbi:MAG: hypothetical protein Q4D32_01890, partial [Eubacteriales bacterium]|nr:hypothetical protein [Eubacteriales bacterium]